MLVQHGKVFDVCGFFDFAPVDLQPLIAVAGKASAGTSACVRKVLYQTSLRLGYLCFRLSVSLPIAVPVCGFSLRCASLYITGFPTAIFPFINVFSFSRHNDVPPSDFEYGYFSADL